MTSGVISVVTYAVLALLWGAVVVAYARQWSATQGERLLRLLLLFLIAEAARTFLESLYFGALWGANYGLFPESWKVLGKPIFLSSMKWVTVGLGIVVLMGVARFWIPTELKQRRARSEAEEKLREQLETSLRETKEREEQFALAAEASRDGLWDDDLRTGKRVLSLRFWQLLGFDTPPPDPTGEVQRRIHPEDFDYVGTSYRDFLKSGGSHYEVRYRIFDKHQAVKHLHLRGLLVRDEKGRPVRLVGFIRDVTDDLLAEENRLQTQKLEGLGVLAGGIAHDFNNLLTVVASSLSMADEQARRGESVNESLTTAQQAVHRAGVLTKQLLAYAGRTSLSQHPLDLNQLVKSISELLSVTMSRKVKLVQQLAPSLPGVLGDDGQLQQVVMNLITNASEAIGDVEGTVTLRTEVLELDADPPGSRTPMPRGRVVCLTVQDTGAGMAPDVLRRALDPFFSTKGTGRGLGLAALAGILRKHGGGIAVESAPGSGTTFRVCLPALAELAPRPQPAVEPPKPTPRREGGVGARVLVVDDEPLLRRSATRLLTMLGCTVKEAASGEDAVARVAEAPDGYDAVLMDLTMPGMDGFEATRRIAKLAPSLTVIVSSGYTAAELPQALPENTRALPKPYDLKQLEAMLREVTRGHAS